MRIEKPTYRFLSPQTQPFQMIPPEFFSTAECFVHHLGQASEPGAEDRTKEKDKYAKRGDA
jgi:hypothetical protein